MRKVLFLQLSLLFLFVAQIANAQTIRITGTITSSVDNYPLEGTGVIVKGTTTGTATNFDGWYEISADQKAVLVISCVGYKTQEIPVNGRSVINVQLDEDTEMLESTIVVGYGSARKISSVVGSAQTVKAKVIQDKPVINAADALQGQVAGLQVYSSSGDPSATVSMRIRGVSSINASTTPLFVLDGTPVLSSIFTTLNPNDIESITVLKDASATAIYGSRASNGVVYITTKRGTGEKPEVKITANYGISNLARNPIEKVNTEEWFQLNEILDPTLLNNASWQANKKLRIDNNIGTNWRKYLLNTNAPTMGADISVSGRTNKTDYYLSFGANRQEGVDHNTGMNRYVTRANVDTKPTDWFKFGVNIGLAFQQSLMDPYNSDYSSSNRNNWYNPIVFSEWALPWWSVDEVLTDDSGNFLGYGDEQTFYIDDAGLYNPLYLLSYQKRKDNYIRLNGNLYEEFTPLKGLTVKFVQGLEGYDYRYSAIRYKDPGNVFTGAASESFTRYYRMTTTNTIEYMFSPIEKHNFIALLGQEAIINNSTGFSAGSSGQTDIRLWSIALGETYDEPGYSYSQYKFNSIFARLSYDYDGKYYVDASFRRDGSSLFGENNRYANFWSIGAMWDIKKENFARDINWLDALELSVSYGTVGNSGISNYLSLGTVGAGGTQYNGTNTWYLANAENKDLTWETVKSFNVGLTARFLDRLDFEFAVYNRKTCDMLMEIPWSYSTGFSGGYGNIGNMVNKGFELTLGADLVQTKNVYLRVSANVSYNHDEITKLFDGRDTFELADYGLCYQVGHSAGEFWYVKYAGIDPANGRPLWYDKDGNITDTYSEDDRILLGKSQFAPWAGGLQIDFQYKNLSVQAQFSGVLGKYMINNDAYFYYNTNFASSIPSAKKVLYNLWTYPGQTDAKFPAPEYVINDTWFDSRLVENASFLRLKGLTISYSLGKKALAEIGNLVSGVRVYATGRNLFTITKYTGWDPEQDTNLQLGVYPNSKQYAVGLEITF